VSGLIWPGATAHGRGGLPCAVSWEAPWAWAWQPSPVEEVAHGAGTRRAHGAVTAHSSRARWCGGALASGSVVAGRWQCVAGELAGAARRAPGKAVGVELTQTVVWCGGGGEVSRQWCSSMGRELRWLVAMEASLNSVGVEEGM
jgi:hypothetical protein